MDRVATAAAILAVLLQLAEGHPDHDHRHEAPRFWDPAAAWGRLKPPICIHDTPEIQRLTHHGMDNVEPQTLVSRRFDPQAVGNIRYAISSLDLDDSSRYCTTAGQSVPDFKGGTVTCTSDDIFTDAKKQLLLQTILPQVTQQLSAMYQVNQISGALTLSSTSVCSPFTIPAAHTTTGLTNTDLVMYISAAPTTGSVAAWAGACAVDQTGRSIAGRANFGPKYIANDTAAQLQSVVITAMHEFTHALGFSSGNFKNVSQITVREKTATIVSSPKVLSRAREFLGCPTLPGMELEDEGGSGSAGSHWERRLVRDETMCGSGGPAYSYLTMAMLEDMGVYIADYTKATAMNFGANAGCSYVTSLCNTTAGGKDYWFCFDSGDGCTYDYTGYGPCGISTYSSALPAYFQYFSNPDQGGDIFMDGCPVRSAYSNRVCNAFQTTTSTDTVLGNFYGNGSRCYNTTPMLIQSGFSSSGGTLRCLQSSCANGQLSFRVGSGDWMPCPADGSEGTLGSISGFSGSILCPKATALCDANISYAVSTPTPATTTATPSTATPSTETPTTLAPGAATTTQSPGVATEAPTTTQSPSSPTTQSPAPPTTGGLTVTPAPPTTTVIVTVPPPAGTTATASPIILFTPTGAPSATTGAPLATRPPPASSTPTPPALTPVPLSVNSPRIIGTVRLRGSNFLGLLLGDISRANLVAALRADISRILSIPTSTVRVDNLTIGSLTVDYAVLGTSLSASQASTDMQGEVGQSNFVTTQALYSQVSAETIVVESQSTTSVAGATSPCGGSLAKADCYAVIGTVVAVGIVVLLALIVVFVRARYKRQKAKPVAADEHQPIPSHPLRR